MKDEKKSNSNIFIAMILILLAFLITGKNGFGSGSSGSTPPVTETIAYIKYGKAVDSNGTLSIIIENRSIKINNFIVTIDDLLSVVNVINNANKINHISLYDRGAIYADYYKVKDLLTQNGYSVLEQN